MISWNPVYVHHTHTHTHTRFCIYSTLAITPVVAQSRKPTQTNLTKWKFIGSNNQKVQGQIFKHWWPWRSSNKQHFQVSVSISFSPSFLQRHLLTWGQASHQHVWPYSLPASLVTTVRKLISSWRVPTKVLHGATLAWFGLCAHPWPNPCGHRVKSVHQTLGPFVAPGSKPIQHLSREYGGIFPIEKSSGLPKYVGST